MKKIKLGISACLLGRQVRYDGKDKLNHRLIELFGGLVEWVPVCPEVESGLTVPRDRMKLVGVPGSVRIVSVETGVDLTENILTCIKKGLDKLEKEELRGFIFKSRSPSCALKDAEIFASCGKEAFSGPGVFSHAIMKRLPFLPLTDEEELEKPGSAQDFIKRIFPERKP